MKNKRIKILSIIMCGLFLILLSKNAIDIRRKQVIQCIEDGKTVKECYNGRKK